MCIVWGDSYSQVITAIWDGIDSLNDCNDRNSPSLDISKQNIVARVPSVLKL